MLTKLHLLYCHSRASGGPANGNPLRHFLWWAALLFFPAASADLPIASTLMTEEAKFTMSGVPAGLIYENLHNPYIFWIELEAGKMHLLERVNDGFFIKASYLWRL